MPKPAFALGGAASKSGPFGWLCLQIAEMPARVRVFVCGAPHSRGECAEEARVALEAEPSEPVGLNENLRQGTGGACLKASRVSNMTVAVSCA